MITCACDVVCEACGRFAVSPLFVSVFCRECSLAMCKACDKSEHELKSELICVLPHLSSLFCLSQIVAINAFPYCALVTQSVASIRRRRNIFVSA